MCRALFDCDLKVGTHAHREAGLGADVLKRQKAQRAEVWT
jgi:hypothetical protein